MRIVIEIEEGTAKVVPDQNEGWQEIPVEERRNTSPQSPPEFKGVIRALQSMKQSYTMTWEDRRREFGRGFYKIRRLFREAEKAGLL